jgi:hypothetical protein
MPDPANRAGTEVRPKDRARRLAADDRRPGARAVHPGPDSLRRLPRDQPVTIKGKEYRYPRYFFTQVSKDIQGLFSESLDRLGIEYRFSGSGKDVTIHRRAGVARLDAFVGPKS